MKNLTQVQEAFGEMVKSQDNYTNAHNPKVTYQLKVFSLDIKKGKSGCIMGELRMLSMTGLPQWFPL